MWPTCSQPGKPGVCGTRPNEGLKPDQPAEGGGDAHRAAAVGAERDRPQAAGHRGGGAAAGAARVRARSHGIARDAEQGIVGDRLVAELRGVRLAEDDRAARLQPADGRRCPPPAPARRTGGSRRWCAARACTATSLSDSGTPCSAPMGSPFMTAISASRAAAAGGVRGHQAERVEARVERLDAGEQRRGELDGRELLVTDQGGDLESGSPGEIARGSRVAPPHPGDCIIRAVSGGARRRSDHATAAGAASGSTIPHGEDLATPDLGR